MTNTTTLYKVVSPEGVAPFSHYRWSLPTRASDTGDWTPGDWHDVSGPLVMCHNGLHLTDERGVWRHWMTTIDGVPWEAEVAGDRIGTLDDATERKIAVARARLLRPMPLPDWWVATRRFITDEIPAIPWLRPDNDPDPAWRLFTETTWASARDSAWASAWDSAWASARASARDSAWASARASAWASARDSARDSAWDSAWNSARDSARDSVRDSVRASAWNSVALMACVTHLCGDLAIDQRHRDHVAARWRVWQKGYAVVCDVDGVLYVAAGPAPS